MLHTNRRFTFITLVLISVLFIFTLTACSSDNSNLYPQDSGGDYESNLGYNEDDNESTFLDEAMSAERAKEIYAAFAEVYASYEEYLELYDEEATAKWESYDADACTLMYQQFLNIAQKLGLSIKNNESEWIENMNFYTSGNLFYRALLSLDSDNDKHFAYLQSVYSYQKGLESGKYEPLDDAILAMADNLTIEYYTGSYLLCTGGDHLIQQMTFDWTMEEEYFNASGSITAVKTDDIFKDISVPYYISGEKGAFNNVEFGYTDFLPIFKSIKAIDDNGRMLSQQINICAVNVFDVQTLFVLSEDHLGIITIAVAEYDKSKDQYVWDKQIYTSRSRCCLNKNNEFYYADVEGDGILRLGKAKGA